MTALIPLVAAILAIVFMWNNGELFKREEPFHIEPPQCRITQPEIDIENFASRRMHIYVLLKHVKHVITICDNDVEKFLDYIEVKYPDDYSNDTFILWCRYWWGVNNSPDSRHKLDSQPLVG